MLDAAEATKRVDQPGLAQEEIPSLADFADEPTGNITPGWYGATVLEGYATQKGTQFTTGDTPGKDGKRELRLCFGIAVGNSVQNRQRTFFYRPEDFSVENIAKVKALREQFKGQRSWAGQGQAQHFSIIIGELGQLEKAVGFKLARHPNGGFITVPYVGKRLDVRIRLGNKGFDEVAGFAPAGKMTSKRA
jgi:hypothetical protein